MSSQPGRKQLSVTEIKNQQDMAKAVFDRYETNHPIAIVPVKDRPNTYVVLLSGTELQNPKQSTHVAEDAAAGFQCGDRYRECIYDALKDAGIKKTDNLIVAGHSLGGMEAQNLVADQRFRENYHASQVITFGSPKTAPEQHGVEYTRFTTVGDPIVHASPRAVFNVDNPKQIEVSDNRLGDQIELNRGAIDFVVHRGDLRRAGPALEEQGAAAIGQHMKYPKVHALAQHEVEGGPLKLDSANMKVYCAYRDRFDQMEGTFKDQVEDACERMGARQSAKDRLRERSGREAGTRETGGPERRTR